VTNCHKKERPQSDKEVFMANKIVATNPTAKHNYIIEKTLEAGIVLTGTEIKSIRNGKINLKDSYAIIKNGEVFIYGMHISPYEHGNIFNKDPLRPRKLLLHKLEIIKLIGQTKQKGYSLIPINLYFSGNFLKITLGVGKGKKLYDKREDIAKRDAEMRVKKEFGKNI
jgi:SsrA-binding protein